MCIFVIAKIRYHGCSIIIEGCMNKFRVTLLISTYNWPEALSLSIKSALNQTVLPDEIVVADDGSTETTLEVIKQLRSESSIPIRHVWHTDEGFRKTIILNNAIRETDGDYHSDRRGYYFAS